MHRSVSMPARRDEAHRALVLLEDYYARLTDPGDAQLRVAIEKVMRIFRSQLFQALLDIQEFYESTLLDESRSIHDRTAEALSMAQKYQQKMDDHERRLSAASVNTAAGLPPPQPPARMPLNSQQQNAGLSSAVSSSSAVYIADKTFSAANGHNQQQQQQLPTVNNDNASMMMPPPPMPAIKSKSPPIEKSHAAEQASKNINHLNQSTTLNARPPPPPSSFFNNTTSDGIRHRHVSNKTSTSDDAKDERLDDSSVVSRIRQILADQNSGRARAVSGGRGPVTEYELDDWQFIDIELERGDGERRGLGFSISGGNDNPQFEGDPSIYITRIIAGGAAHADGRLRVGDALLQVNDDEVIDVPHQVAVEALKRAESCVRLIVRRRRAEPRVLTIELDKRQRGLGFSIAGGVGNEHIPGDVGIYITRIMQGGAAALNGSLSVGDRVIAVGGQNLENVTHEQAVEVLKASSDPVLLTVAKPATLIGASFPILLAVSAGYFQHQRQPAYPYPRNNNNISIGNSIIANNSQIYLPPTTAELLGSSGRTSASRPISMLQPSPPSSTTAHSGKQHHNQHRNFAEQQRTQSSASQSSSLSAASQQQRVATVAQPPAAPPPPPPPLSMTELSSIKQEVDNIFARSDDFLGGNRDTAQANSSVGGVAVENDELLRDGERRTVMLTKGPNGLGFNIVGGEDGEGIFVSYLMPGGPAEKSESVKRADQIIAVNGVELISATHEQAANALKSASNEVALVLQQRPLGNGIDAAGSTASSNGGPFLTAIGSANEYKRFESKMNAVRDQWERDQQQQQPNGHALPSNGVAAANDGATNATDANGHANGVGAAALHNRQRTKRSFHVRSLFDYDPSKDSNLPNRGLPFCFGDILHVINASDDEWWQAKRVNIAADNAEEGLGIIPSRQTVIKREKARLKSVSFNADLDSSSAPNATTTSTARSNSLERGTLSGGGGDASSVSQHNKKSHSFSRKLGLASRAASKDNNVVVTNNSTAAADSSAHNAAAAVAATVTGTSSDDQDSVVHVASTSGASSSTTTLHIKSYEAVSLQKVIEPRPLVVFGLLKDRINEDLTTQFPERFAQCVPHTTRPKREAEVEGKDYHFVQSREQMERDIQSGMFIEAGQYNDNLYGTSVKAVKEIAVQGKHCVLDVNGPALRRLRASGFFPVVVAVRPKSVENIIELNKRMSQEQAIREFERARKLDDEYGHLFTAIVQGDSLDELYVQVKDIIVRESNEQSWLPSNEKI